MLDFIPKKPFELIKPMEPFEQNITKTQRPLQETLLITNYFEF